MWNVIAIDVEGECHKINEDPLDGEEVGLLIDHLNGITSLLLQPTERQDDEQMEHIPLVGAGDIMVARSTETS